MSPRTAREAEIVRHGAEALHVALELEGPGGAHRREIGFAPGRGRRLRLDGEPVRSLAQWRARAVLVFLPDELRAVKGPPAARRRALDRVLEASVPGFAEDLVGYQQALAQRNALLRRVRAGAAERGHPAGVGGAHGAARAPGSPRPAGPASPPWPARSRPGSSSWAGGAGGELRLETSPSGIGEVADDRLEEALARTFAERRPREIQAAQTLSGPHRDDLWIGAAGRTCAGRAARASSAPPRSRCCWRPATTCAPARRGPSCSWTTCSASWTRPAAGCCWRPCATAGRPW